MAQFGLKWRRLEIDVFDASYHVCNYLRGLHFFYQTILCTAFIYTNCPPPRRLPSPEASASSYQNDISSGSTTCLVVMILLAVVLLFVMILVLIQFSRR